MLETRLFFFLPFFLSLGIEPEPGIRAEFLSHLPCALLIRQKDFSFLANTPLDELKLLELQTFQPFAFVYLWVAYSFAGKRRINQTNLFTLFYFWLVSLSS
jgi:hypothetical protein